MDAGAWNVFLAIEGMTCNSCVEGIQSVVSDQSGVKSVDVSLENNEGVVKFDPLAVSAERLRFAVEDMGFDAEIKEVRSASGRVVPHASLSRCVLSVEGMTCQSCVSSIESTLSSVAGVEHVRVSLADGQAVILHGASVDPESMRFAVDEMGFGACILEPSAESESIVSIRVVGMTCQSCVKTIEEALSKRNGVLQVTVSLSEGLARVKIDDTVTGAAELVRCCG